MSQPKIVYRALTRERTPSDKSFRLRPATEHRLIEEFLSIATSKEKAIGPLDAKGWASLVVEKIEAIPGVTVRVKVNQPDPPDLDLLEVVGLPRHDDPDSEKITNYAQAMLLCVVASGPAKKEASSG